jgi:hypothetical protein
MKTESCAEKSVQKVSTHNSIDTVGRNTEEIEGVLIEIENRLRSTLIRLSGSDNKESCGEECPYPDGVIPVIILNTEKSLNTAARINSLISDLQDIL